MDNEQLTQVIEKVTTINLNANTNIDVQTIVNNFMLYQFLSTVVIVAAWLMALLSVLYFLFRAARYFADQELKTINHERVDKIAKLFRDLREVESLDKKLNEILEYMPRNKTKRKILEKD